LSFYVGTAASAVQPSAARRRQRGTPERLPRKDSGGRIPWKHAASALGGAGLLGLR